MNGETMAMLAAIVWGALTVAIIAAAALVQHNPYALALALVVSMLTFLIFVAQTATFVDDVKPAANKIMTAILATWLFTFVAACLVIL